MSRNERFNGTDNTAARTFSEDMRRLVDEERAKGGLLLPFSHYSETADEARKTEERFPFSSTESELGSIAVSRFEKGDYND